MQKIRNMLLLPISEVPIRRSLAVLGVCRPAELAESASLQVVLNGLDNIEARRHVNRLCLAAGVPLVESGTTGYKGQVDVHIKGRTPCFECVTPAAPKTFPTCTITNTPSQVCRNRA